MSGQDRLKSEIIDGGLCSSCGMCAGICPYIKTAGDSIRVIYPCGLEEGTCYNVCPRVGFDIREMDMAVFGCEREDHALGVMKSIYYSRAKNKATGSQYGGVTSALAALLLEEGIVSALSLTGGSAHSPRPVLARTVEDIYSCAGSKYTGVPTLEVLTRAILDGDSSLGMVGRPCQAVAVRRIQQDNLQGKQFAPGSINFVLGLFCFWSLSSEFYDYLVGQVGDEKVFKMDIPVDGVMVETASGVFSRQLDDIKPFIKKSCEICFDSTSEWADLSIGSTEHDPTWNTLIVRSSQGKELLNLALQAGVLEIKEYPRERLPLLRKAALNKKMRVINSPEFRGRPDNPILPLEYRKQTELQWGGVC